MTFEGGLMAVSVDSEGRLEPRAAWFARRAQTSIGLVLDELRSRSDVTLVPRSVASEAKAKRRRFELPAELNALYAAAAEIRAWGWRLRPMAELERLDISFSVNGRERTASVVHFLDLPDGTCLAVHWGNDAFQIVRLRIDRVVARQRELSFLEGRVSTENAREVPVVARSIAELFQHALRTNGSTELPTLSTLFDVLPEWQKR